MYNPNPTRSPNPNPGSVAFQHQTLPTKPETPAPQPPALLDTTRPDAPPDLVFEVFTPLPRNPEPDTRNTKTETRNPKPYPSHARPRILHPKPLTPAPNTRPTTPNLKSAQGTQGLLKGHPDGPSFICTANRPLVEGWRKSWVQCLTFGCTVV